MRKKRKHNKTVFVILIIIFILLSLRALFYLFNEYRFSLWDKKSNFGIAVVGSDYLFVEINSSTQKIYIIKLPKNTKINTQKFGSNYTLEGIVKLGQIDSKIPDYFKSSISSFLAVPVDAFYKNPTLTFENFDLKLTDVIQKHTSLTIFDYFAIKNTGFKIQLIDLSKEIGQVLDQKLNVFFQDDYLNKQESLFKIITNQNNDINAKFYERLITNLGFKLADLEFDEKKSPKRNICIFKNQKQVLLSLKNIFSCDVQIDEGISFDVVLRLAD